MSERRLGVARALVDGRWVEGDVRIGGDGEISSVGGQPAGRGGMAVPGFVDLQVNGFAGVDFSDCDLDGYRAAAAALAGSGVTSFMITIPTAAPDRYPDILALAVTAMHRGLAGARPLGVHLEGPFLTRPGAHRPDWLRPPSSEACDRFVDMAPVAMMTMAPEPHGALDVVRYLTARGVAVSIGHTDADATQTHLGFDAGARAVTHLWNAQTAPTARDPGVVGAALARPGVYAGIIADLLHVATDTLLFSLAALGDRAVVVSDASTFAGLDPSVHRSRKGISTLRDDGSVRLDDGTLAGSASGLHTGLCNLVSIGVTVERAVDAVSAAAGRLLRRPALGRLLPGGRADVVVLDDAFQVVRTLVGGRDVGPDVSPSWAAARRPPRR